MPTPSKDINAIEIVLTAAELTFVTEKKICRLRLSNSKRASDFALEIISLYNLRIMKYVEGGVELQDGAEVAVAAWSVDSTYAAIAPERSANMKHLVAALSSVLHDEYDIRKRAANDSPLLATGDEGRIVVASLRFAARGNTHDPDLCMAAGQMFDEYDRSMFAAIVGIE